MAEYFCDNARHLVCIPYCVPELHRMAAALNIKWCWFHRTHYDISKKRIAEIKAKCTVVDSRIILHITKNHELPNDFRRIPIDAT